MTAINKLLKQKIHYLNQEAGDFGTLLQSVYSEQLSFILDPSPFRAALTPRRAGKTWAVAYSLLYKCFKYPGAITAYLNRSETAAIKTINPVLKKLNKQHNLNLNFKSSDKTWYFPNGSEILITGADANQKQQDKFRGQSYKHLSLDEAAFFKTDLRLFFDDVLLHLIAGEEGGQIDFISSPGLLTHGLYYETVQTNNHPEWSKHSWDWKANIALKDLLQKTLDSKLNANPKFIETPSYKREWLGEFVLDDGSLIFHFDNKSTLNRVAFLPVPINNTKYTTIGSIDLGYEDATAYTIASYSPHDHNLYFRWAEKHKHMTADDAVAYQHKLHKDFNVDYWIGDTGGGGSKQIIKTFAQRYNVPIFAPNKIDKHGQCFMMDSDLRMGKIKLVSNTCEALIEEWNNLIIDADAKKRNTWKPHSACEDHLADSARYLWSSATNFTATNPTISTPHRSTKEYIDQYMEDAANKLAFDQENPFSELEQQEELINLNPISFDGI